MKRLSAFDLDHTLVFSNSSLLFYRYLVSKGFYRSISLTRTTLFSIRHHFFNLSLVALHKKIFDRFLKGKPINFVQEEVIQFLRKDFYRFLHYPTFERLRRAQHQGHHTVILSNAPSFIVGPIAEYLEVNQWYSSRYSVDEEGNFKAIESILLGSGKAECIHRIKKEMQITSQQITAYSDSDLDLPFLLYAGTPIAVNPNSELLKISKKNSWEII